MVLVLFFFGLQMTVEIINERFWLNDFRVYFDAGGAYLNGNSPYGEAFGLSSGYFKYSPLALLTTLFYQLNSFESARFIHYFLMVVAYCGIFIQLSVIGQSSGQTSRQLRTASFFVFLITVMHLSRELHLGNINLFLIFAVTYSLRLFLNERILGAAMVMTFVVFFKPYFLLLGLPLMAYRQWKFIGLVLGFASSLLLLQLLIFGPASFTNLYGQWFDSMTDHSSGMPAFHTFSAIIKNYSGIAIGTTAELAIISVISFLYLVFRTVWKPIKQPATFVFDVFLLLALIPNLVTTDIQHFLYSTPLIFLCFVQLIRKPQFLWIICFVILCLLYAANSSDILGKETMIKVGSYSIIGIANLGIILFALLLRNRKTISS